MGLIAMMILDLRDQYCPDALSLPMMWLGLAYHNLHPQGVSPIDALLGTIAGYAVFRLWAFSYERLRHREGLGEGDAKILAVGGAWLGWQALPSLVALAASSACLVIYLGIRCKKMDRDQRIPFGPFLLLSGLVLSSV